MIDQTEIDRIRYFNQLRRARKEAAAEKKEDMQPMFDQMDQLKVQLEKIRCIQASAQGFEADDVIYYKTLKETLLKDYRFKLIFNFTNYRPIHRHYEKLSAFDVIDLKGLRELASGYDDLSDVLKRALCRG